MDRACNACFVTRGNRSILALEEINAKGKSTELVKSSQNILNSLQAMAKLFQSNIFVSDSAILWELAVKKLKESD